MLCFYIRTGTVSFLWLAAVELREGSTVEPLHGAIYRSLAHAHCFAAPGELRLICGEAVADRSRGKSEQRSVVFIMERRATSEQR